MTLAPALVWVLYSLDVSRDNKLIVVALSKPDSDVWLVERK